MAGLCSRADEQALTGPECRFSNAVEMTAENTISGNLGMWRRWPSTSHEARPAIV
jgi:hypothetical protein